MPATTFCQLCLFSCRVSVLGSVLYSFFSVNASLPFHETEPPVFLGIKGSHVLPSSAGQKTESHCEWQHTIHVICTKSPPEPLQWREFSRSCSHCLRIWAPYLRHHKVPTMHQLQDTFYIHCTSTINAVHSHAVLWVCISAHSGPHFTDTECSQHD